jgi:hypothetical protein
MWIRGRPKAEERLLSKWGVRQRGARVEDRGRAWERPPWRKHRHPA